MGNTGSIFCSIFRTTKRDGGSQRQGRSPFPSSGRDKPIRPLRLSNLWPQIAGKLDWVGQLLGKPVLPGRAGPLLDELQEGSLLPRVVPMVHGPSGNWGAGGRADRCQLGNTEGGTPSGRLCSVGLGSTPLRSGLDPFNKGFEWVLVPGPLFSFCSDERTVKAHLRHLPGEELKPHEFI